MHIESLIALDFIICKNEILSDNFCEKFVIAFEADETFYLFIYFF